MYNITLIRDTETEREECIKLMRGMHYNFPDTRDGILVKEEEDYDKLMSNGFIVLARLDNGKKTIGIMYVSYTDMETLLPLEKDKKVGTFEAWTVAYNYKAQIYKAMFKVAEQLLRSMNYDYIVTTDYYFNKTAIKQLKNAGFFELCNRNRVDETEKQIYIRDLRKGLKS